MRWIRRKFPPNPSQIKLRSYANSLLKLRQQPELITAMVDKGGRIPKDLIHHKGQSSALELPGLNSSMDHVISRELISAPHSPHFRTSTAQAFGPLSVPSFHRRGVSAFGTFDFPTSAASRPESNSHVDRHPGQHRDSLGVQIVPSSIHEDRDFRSNSSKRTSAKVVAESVVAQIQTNVTATATIENNEKNGLNDVDNPIHVITFKDNPDMEEVAANKNTWSRVSRKNHQIQPSDLNEIPESRENSISGKHSKKKVARNNCKHIWLWVHKHLIHWIRKSLKMSKTMKKKPHCPTQHVRMILILDPRLHFMKSSCQTLRKPINCKTLLIDLSYLPTQNCLIRKK